MLGPDAPPIYTSGVEPTGDSLDTSMAVTEVGLAGTDAVTVWRPLDRDVPT